MTHIAVVPPRQQTAPRGPIGRGRLKRGGEGKLNVKGTDRLPEYSPDQVL